MLKFRAWSALIAGSLSILPLSGVSKPEDLLAQLPLRFEENRGQAAAEIRYIARAPGFRLDLLPTQNWMTLGGPPDEVIHTELEGASKLATMEATALQEAPTNYFLGNQPENWRTGIRNFGKVQVNQIYPGVDLVFYGTAGKLEYDFVIQPGANPDMIRFRIDGARKLSVGPHGDLVLETAAGEVTWKKPALYQTLAGRRQPVSGAFVLEGSRVKFRTGPYDRGLPLIIDPVLTYASYFGASGNEAARGIGMDAAGNLYVAGITNSRNLPVTTGAFQTAYGGETLNNTSGDAFVAKFNPSGSSLLYLTYVGGSRDDAATSLAVDGQGNAYITGATTSADFPVTPGALQTKFGGIGGNTCVRIGDAFVTKLNPSGTQLVYSTFLGGALDDIGSSIAIDSAGNAYIAGATVSTDFPVTAGAYQTKFAGFGGQVGKPFCGGAPGYNAGDAFVAKLNPAGSQLVFATYLGGTLDDAATAIAIDSSQNVYVAGATLSRNFPASTGAFQTSFHGIDQQNVFFNFGDAFVTKLNNTGSGLVYSTYLGGHGDDLINNLFVDAAGTAYVAGSTSSMDFPVTANAIQSGYAGYFTLPFLVEQLMGDAFVTRLNATGTGLLYSTYFGGLENDVANGVAVDDSGLIYLVGATDSRELRVSSDAAQTAFGGDGGQGQFLPVGDGFLLVIDPNSKTPVYSTFFGGILDDAFVAPILDGNGGLWIVGNTVSNNLAVTSGALQKTYGGARNFVFVKGDLVLARFTIPAEPRLAANGAVNGASFVAGSAAAGEIATVFGTNLTSATGINLTSTLPLPGLFLNVSLLVNGLPAPLFAVDNVNGQQQINFQVPWEVAGQQSFTLQVVNGFSSQILTVPVAAAQPGIFNYSVGGNTFGAILHSDFQLADTAHPVKAGEVVLIYCTGLGAVANQPASGAAATGNETTAAKPSVTIGGIAAPVSFSGLAPQFVGLYQVNAQVPQGLSSQNLPVVIQISGASSNSVLLPVK